MRGFLVLIILPIILYAAFRKPVIGAGLWLWSSAFNINALIYGFAASITYSKFFALVTIISIFINSKSVGRFRFDIISVLVFFLFVIATLSNINPIGNVDLANLRWVFYFKIVLLYFITVLVLEKKSHFYFFCWILLLSIGIMASMEGIKFIFSAGSHRFAQLDGISGDNNFFGVMIVTLLPLVYYLYLETRDKKLKLILLGFIPLLILGLISTYSRGAFIGLCTLMFFSWKGSNRKIIWLLAGLTLGIIFTALTPEVWLSRMNTIESANEDGSFMGRVVAWKMAVLIAQDYFLGGGFHAIEHLEVWFKYSDMLDRLDFIETPPPDPEFYHSFHSVYFQILGNHGFPGLTLFLGIIIIAYLKLAKIIKFTTNKEDYEWMLNLAKMLKYSLVAYSVTGAAVNVAYFDFFYAIIAFIVVLDIKFYAKIKNNSITEPSKSKPG